MKKTLTLILALLVCFRFALPAQTANSKKISAILEDVNKALNAQDPEKALSILQEARRAYPEDPEIMYYQARVFKVTGDLEGASSMALEVLKAKNVDYKLVGLALLLVSDDVDVHWKMEQLEKALKEAPEDAQLNILKASYLMRLGEPGALNAFRIAQESQPDHPIPYFKKSMIFMHSAHLWAGVINAEIAILLSKGEVKENPDFNATLRAVADTCFVIEGTEVSTRFSIEHYQFPDTVSARKFMKERLPFTHYFDVYMMKGLATYMVAEQRKDMNITTLYHMRTALLDSWVEKYRALYGPLCLFDYWEQVRKAGYWKEYQYYIWGEAFPEDFRKFNASGLEVTEKYENMLKWVEAHPIEINQKNLFLEDRFHYTNAPRVPGGMVNME